ncbi:MAG: hypothetical protein K8U57_06075 [Planctomycetes bacterium]|nr:hypothetical protein [Planctomycetota bacterium]
MNIRVGGVGRAVSALSPSGYVEIDGMRHSAKSEGSYIKVGSAVIVMRGDTFGLIVREIEPGKSQPAIPNVGDIIGKPEHQLNSADVAEIEREQQRRDRAELRQSMKIGAAITGAFGLVFGLANAAIGSHFNWADVNESASVLLLFGGSAIACVVDGITLYFLTGWFAPHIFPYEERVFAADFLGIVAGLLGGLLGFWIRFGEDPGTVVLWSVGLTFAFAGVGCGISWLLSLVAN